MPAFVEYLISTSEISMKNRIILIDNNIFHMSENRVSICSGRNTRNNTEEYELLWAISG